MTSSQPSLEDIVRALTQPAAAAAPPPPPAVPDNTLETLITIFKPMIVQLVVDNLKDRPQLQPFAPMLVDLVLSLLLKKHTPAAVVPVVVPPTAPPPAPVPPTTPPVAVPPTAPAAPGLRKFSGLKGSYGNYQHGPEGQIHGTDSERGQEVFHNGGNIDAANEKTKFIMYLTPLVDGEALEPGDPENEQIVVDEYGVVFDGKEFWGDDIQQTPIELNNYEASHGMDPRVVIAAGLKGAHTFAGLAKVNGFTWRGGTLYINRH